MRGAGAMPPSGSQAPDVGTVPLSVTRGDTNRFVQSPGSGTFRLLSPSSRRPAAFGGAFVTDNDRIHALTGKFWSDPVLRSCTSFVVPCALQPRPFIRYPDGITRFMPENEASTGVHTPAPLIW